MREYIELLFNNKKILGLIDFPENSNNKNNIPCVIFLYGLNGNRVDVNRLPVKLSRALNRDGIACVRFDYLGCGVSEGNFSESTSKSRVEQTNEVIKYIKSNRYFKDSKIGIIGFSDGCRIVLDVIESNINNLEINSLALWSPVFIMNKKASISDQVKKSQNEKTVYRDIFKKSKIDKTYNISAYGQWLNPRYHDGFSDTSYTTKILDVIKKKATLSIFGSDDKSSAPTKEYLEKYSSQFSIINTIDNADHVFNSVEWINEVINLTASHFKGTLKY